MADVVTHEEWIEARIALLLKEKEFTRMRDQLSAERRALPWEPVTTEYVFEGDGGYLTLQQLFGDSSQLIVYHFMFAPDWDAGCPHCSFWADNFNGIPLHLKARDVSFVAVSRAPHAKLAAYRKRMGWEFEWVSSLHNTFTYDYFASFKPDEIADGTAFFNYKRTHPPDSVGSDEVGISVFSKDGAGQMFHTYSTFARGVDVLNGAYHYLDLVPNGRGEHGHDNPQFWVRRHDEY